MHPDEFLDALRREGGAMAVAAQHDLDRPVPSCPGWDLRQLVNHMGRVHRWVTAMVRSQSAERLDFPPRPPVIDAGWLAEGVALLAGALAEAGPDSPAWTFTGAGTARFWFRRQAEETAVHRWDAEAAIGEPSPIETELALAGVDEVLDVFLAGRSVDLGGSVHLHATDSPHGEWIVRTAGDGAGLMVGHGHEKGDAALRGTASDLLLWLWGRDVPDDRIEVMGDGSILERWSENLKIG